VGATAASIAKSRGAWLISHGQDLLRSGFEAGALLSWLCVSQQQEWCAEASACSAAIMGQVKQAGAPMRIAANRAVRRLVTLGKMRMRTLLFKSFFLEIAGFARCALLVHSGTNQTVR